MDHLQKAITFCITKSQQISSNDIIFGTVSEHKRIKLDMNKKMRTFQMFINKDRHKTAYESSEK